MLIPHFLQNTQTVTALLYFLAYAVAFCKFCSFFMPFLVYSTNVSTLGQYLQVKPKQKRFLITLLFSLLGVPPLLPFTSKFVALSNVWAHSDWLFFFFAMLVTFFSFALYLQIFDLTFNSKKTRAKFGCVPRPNYSLGVSTSWFTCLFFIVGVVCFKDFFLILTFFS